MKRLEFNPKLPLDEIDVSLSNARKTNLEEGIDELAKSIEEIGIQQPVVVFKKKDGRYELIIGQRRYLACIKLGLREIPALITTVKNATDAAIKSFSENIHRLDLDYQDKMQVTLLLLNELGTVKKVADHLGLNPQTVRNYLGYAGVEEDIKKMVDEGKLSATTALLITKNVSDKKQALDIAKKVKEIPRAEDRKKLIYVAKENPDKTASEVIKIVKRQELRKITIYLTESVYKSLEDASKKYETDKEDVAVEGVEEWLRKRGFIK
jgi:ParB family chromosome partitioning protein